MRVRITMCNTAGELAVTEVEDEGNNAKDALIEMVDECGSIEAGDTFTVREVE